MSPMVLVESWAEYHGVKPEDEDFTEFCFAAEREQKLYGHKIMAWKRIPSGVAFKVVQDDNRDQLAAMAAGEWDR